MGLKVRFFITCVISFFVSLAPAQANWHEVKTDNFIVSGDATLSTLKKFATELEQFRVFIAVVSGQQPTPEPTPVNVTLMASSGSFERIISGRTIAGVYTAALDGGVFIANVSARTKKRGVAAEIILRHEYVHHYSYRTGPFYYPLWYREGIADYFASFIYDDGVAKVGEIIEGRITELQYGEWLPLEYVIRSRLRWHKPEGRNLTMQDVLQYYAQSWFTAHHLQSTPERAVQLNSYLNKVREGANSAETFEREFGVTFEEMELELEEVFRKGRLPLKLYNLSSFYHEPELIVTRLSRSEGEIRRALAGSYFGLHNAERRADRIADLEAVSRKNPKDLRVLYRLALLEHEKGDPAKAAAHASRIFDLYPTSTEALILEGLFLKRELEKAPDNFDDLLLQAREKFDMARQQSPDNPRAHYEFSKTFIHGPSSDLEPAITAAIRALELSPEPLHVPFNCAILLARGGYNDDAIFLLEGLASWSSDPKIRASARRELLRLR